MDGNMKFSLTLSILALFVAVNGDQNIIISKGFIAKVCSDSTCHQTTEKSLLGDCQRGCRFFDYAQTSNLAESNETAFHSLCIDSCNDAYAEGKNLNACITGCDNARGEIDRIIQMGNHLLEEADKQMNFLNSIFDMMSSTFWNSDEGDSEEEDDIISKVAGHLIDGNGQAKVNRLDKQIDEGDVEIITLLGNDMGPAETSYCATRLWLHRLSFILIVLGAMSLLFISFFYLVAIIKHKKANSGIAELTVDESMTSPPSYETLVKNGYIVVDANDMVAPVHEKKEKILI